MIDFRFYERMGAPTAAVIAAAVGGSLIAGDQDAVVSSLASASTAGEGDLSFLENGRESAVEVILGGVCLVPEGGHCADGAHALVEVKSPRRAFARASVLIAAPRAMPPGDWTIHPTARVHVGAVLEPGCVVGPGASIGEDSRIGAGSIIGPGVQIGQSCRIGPRSVIGYALLGDEVVTLPGVVIGETGFGLGHGPEGPTLVPHFGRVIIQDRVSIGANSTIDRGFLTDTTIGEGAQIDNMCHIGHNVQVGRSVVMAAFAGISGSVEIGDGAMLGGRVGVSDHVRIGRGSKLAAGSAVMRDVPDGESHGGYPAKAMRTWMRELAWLAQAAQKRLGGKS